MVHALRRAEVILANTKNSIPDEERSLRSQSLPLGDTGDGNTGVPSDEQGISNRRGDRPDGVSAQADEPTDEDVEDDDDDDDDLEDDEDEDEEDEDDEDDEDEDEDVDEDVDEQTDPRSEPGKPV
jgi:hypothetical protein